MTDPKDSSDPIPLTPSEPPASPSETPSPAPAASGPTPAPLDFGGPLVPSSVDDESFPVEPEPEQSAPRVTPTPTAARSAAPVPDAPKRPLVQSTRIEWPLAVAGCCAALFVAACIGGQHGIFPRADGVEVTIAERLVMLLRGILMMLLCGGCLVAGAALFHMVDRRPLGDLRALAARMLMISSVALLSRVFPIDIAFLKQTYDVIAPIAVAWAMILALFRLNPRDAATVVGAAILSLIILGFGSTIVSFAIWAGSAAATT